ncbi:hypothetical protein ACIP5Y_47280 [Nocardia sp. NPDC088792]|uniref:hypothetical protein n=1 Tax=Nocardia sp. NPDC088792 TaxID=3364332 RepID=UPI00380CF1B0
MGELLERRAGAHRAGEYRATQDYPHDRGISYTRENLDFLKYIRKVIFPGGCLPLPDRTVFDGVEQFAEAAGFDVIQFTCAK